MEFMIGFTKINYQDINDYLTSSDTKIPCELINGLLITGKEIKQPSHWLKPKKISLPEGAIPLAVETNTEGGEAIWVKYLVPKSSIFQAEKAINRPIDPSNSSRMNGLHNTHNSYDSHNLNGDKIAAMVNI